MTDSPVPSAEGPADPLGALLHQMMRGDASVELIQSALRDSRLDLAMNGDGRPLVVRSFDDLPCVVVATSARQRERTFAPEWRRVELAELVELLPDGIDLLVDPDGPEPVRLAAAIVWYAIQSADEDPAG